MRFPVDNTLYLLSQLIAGGIKPVLRDSTGRGLLEAFACFRPDCPRGPFPLLIFLLILLLK